MLWLFTMVVSCHLPRLCPILFCWSTPIASYLVLLVYVIVKASYTVAIPYVISLGSRTYGGNDILAN